MKFLTALIGLVVLSMFACKKSKVEPTTPACIQSNIDANKDKPSWGISSVDEYHFQGMEVYVFQPDPAYADAQAPIYTADCTVFCSLGGLTGNTMCNGEKFSDKAVFVRNIWHK